jgi:CubicO group peptidase (beta-lactamase class C family)
MRVPRTVVVDRLGPPLRARLETLIGRAVPVVAPAVAIAVTADGEPRLVASFGWLEPGGQSARLPPDARFDLASITKIVTMSAFLALVSEGRVSLDDRVGSVVPELGSVCPHPVGEAQEPLSRRMIPVPPERAGWIVEPAAITFRQLLTHTSGLAPWRAVFEAAGPTPSPPDKPDRAGPAERMAAGIAAVCRYPLVDRPGRAIAYSDLGFMLLGEAVSRIGGASLADVVALRIGRPLGLQSLTYAPLTAGVARQRVVPTSVDTAWRGRRCWGEVEDENAAGLGGIAGHAGLFATAADVAAIGQAWLARDPRLGIDEGLMDDAVRVQAAGSGDRRGLGWQLHPGGAGDGAWLGPLGSRAFGHTGFTGTSLAVDPERGLVVALLTNRVHAGRTHPGIDGLRASVHAALASRHGS